MPGFVAVTVGLWMLVQLPVAPVKRCQRSGYD
jgi:hypothetical protein